MYPTLAIQGDYLFCVRTPFLKTFLSRRAPHVDRGDLIDYISPTDPTYSVCKRVIGIEGDVVCVDPSGEKGRKGDWVKVPIGYVWATGDNLSNSNDSRDYGPVPIGLIRGKVLARVGLWLGKQLKTGRELDDTRDTDVSAFACRWRRSGRTRDGYLLRETALPW